MPYLSSIETHIAHKPLHKLRNLLFFAFQDRERRSRASNEADREEKRRARDASQKAGDDERDQSREQQSHGQPRDEAQNNKDGLDKDAEQVALLTFTL